MVDLSDYGEHETAWCPGCGNFGILASLKKALVACSLAPRQVLLVSGIGQAAKTPHYLNVNLFNGLHGRSLPVAIGARLANPELTVIAESGDGCIYGEGGNHFLAALRRNVNITILAHDNRVYGLTKGQASPTSERGFVSKAQPHGSFSEPFNPVAVAVTMGTSFVGRGYAGNQDHLAALITQAILHKGTALIDILQPCVSFNTVNSYQWYKARCYELGTDHDYTDRDAALRVALAKDDHIPLGLIWKEEKPLFEEQYSALQKGPLCRQEVSPESLQAVMMTYQ